MIARPDTTIGWAIEWVAQPGHDGRLAALLDLPALVRPPRPQPL